MSPAAFWRHGPILGGVKLALVSGVMFGGLNYALSSPSVGRAISAGAFFWRNASRAEEAARRALAQDG